MAGAHIHKRYPGTPQSILQARWPRISIV
jgi:hypothetical protein